MNKYTQLVDATLNSSVQEIDVIIYNYRNYLVDETGLAHIWITTEKQGPRVGVDGGETGQMLTHWWRSAQLETLNWWDHLNKEDL